MMKEGFGVMSKEGIAINKTWAKRIAAARKACKFNRDDKKELVNGAPVQLGKPSI